MEFEWTVKKERRSASSGWGDIPINLNSARLHHLSVAPIDKPATKILLAEDCEDDAIILSRSLRRAQVNHVLVRVMDGEEAITYLMDKPRPDLVLLDLKMPKLDGFDVLAFIQTKPDLKGLPVIVLTGSDWSRDKRMAEALGVKDYLVKGPDWDAVATALKLSIAKALGS